MFAQRDTRETQRPRELPERPSEAPPRLQRGPESYPGGPEMPQRGTEMPRQTAERTYSCLREAAERHRGVALKPQRPCIAREAQPQGRPKWISEAPAERGTDISYDGGGGEGASD